MAISKEDEIIEVEKRKEHLAKIAMDLIKGCEDVNARNYLLMIASTMYGEAAGNGISGEVDSALKMAYRKIYGAKRSLTQEITDWVKITSNNFSITDVYQDITIITKRDKAKVITVLHRLKNKNVIESVTNRHGVYRRVLDDAPFLDPWSCTTDCLDIIYPLSIHELCKTMSKNLIVIAGEGNAGKTAFLMNFASLNMNRGWEIRYMSSEMGSGELRSRLDQFEQNMGITRDYWKGLVEFRDKSIGFHDLILPDGINIIDFLEKADKFYTIAEDLRLIYEKLDNGIAVVAIQKDNQSEYARGGAFTMEKPRIYISLVSNPPEGNIAKIVKCKNFVRSDVNPNGRQCHFRLRGGCEFIADTNWILPRRKEK